MNVGEMFGRATIQGVVDYILFGDEPEKDERTYEERLDEPYQKLEKEVTKYEREEDSRILELSNELQNETACVYAEIGLQAGILLMKDMMENLQRERKGEDMDTEI